MSETQELELIREYKVGVERLWQVVTDPAEIVQWFGPEGVDIDDCEMAFTDRGPWFCKMRGRESGNIFHVSGTVTHVRTPQGASDGSVGFTWAWHDAEIGTRGDESHVIFEVSAKGDGAQLRLIHRDLASVEQAQDHSKGWLSTLRKLDSIITN